MEGFINLNKPSGPTSHDMVNVVRGLLHERRVGHGGTLDPLAQGVLPIGVGRATRLLAFLQETQKAYRAEVLLGVSTTTYDAAGEVTAVRPVPPLDLAELEKALSQFRGEIEQVPPSYSAIRQGGRRLHQRARAGEKVQPAPRKVQIHRLTLLSHHLPHLTLEVDCGSGTYIRSLAHDVGERLGCGAHLVGLVRLRVGVFLLEQAVTAEDLEMAVAQGGMDSVLLPMDFPLRHWPVLEVSEEEARFVLNGQSLDFSQRDVPAELGRARAYDQAGRFLALLRFEESSHCWHPFRVFPPLENTERPQ